MSNRIAGWIGVLLLPVVWGSPVRTASIQGELRASSEVRKGSSPGWQNAVVWIENVPANVEWKLALKATPSRVTQVRQQFSPRIQVVTVGSRVRFENRDSVFHNVFTRSPENVFDAGHYAPGQSRPIMFDSVGVVQLYCEIHPQMSGTIIVVPNHAWTRPAASGAFEIAELPPGTYVVKAWHPTYGSIRAEVTVPLPKNTMIQLQFDKTRKPNVTLKKLPAGKPREPARTRVSPMPGGGRSGQTATTQRLRNSGGRFSR